MEWSLERALRSANDDTRAATPPGTARVGGSAGITALRAALQARLRHALAENGMTRALHVFTLEACRAGLDADELVRALKLAWDSVPEARALPPQLQQDMLDRLITRALELRQAENGGAR